MRILGIDPAWTIEKNPSGIALVEGNTLEGWKCVALSSSIEEFTCKKSIEQTLKKDHFLNLILDKTGDVDCIVLDIPLSHNHTHGRRLADDKITEKYNIYRCPALSAPDDVFTLGRMLLQQVKGKYSFNENIIETYPHPAILQLIPDLDCRLQYKTNRAHKYWSDKTASERIELLKVNMNMLKSAIIKNNIILPNDFFFDNVTVKSKLKPFEDMLDALVCAWVGIIFKNQRNSIVGYGNEDSKIWIPSLKKLNALPIEK